MLSHLLLLEHHLLFPLIDLFGCQVLLADALLRLFATIGLLGLLALVSHHVEVLVVMYIGRCILFVDFRFLRFLLILLLSLLSLNRVWLFGKLLDCLTLRALLLARHASLLNSLRDLFFLWLCGSLLLSCKLEGFLIAGVGLDILEVETGELICLIDAGHDILECHLWV